jgi:ABC-type transport system substrate-binding protein
VAPARPNRRTSPLVPGSRRGRLASSAGSLTAGPSPIDRRTVHVTNPARARPRPARALPTSPFNETHFADPAYTKLYGQALATLDPAQRTEIAHEMQMIDYEQGEYIIPFFPSIIDGYALASTAS